MIQKLCKELGLKFDGKWEDFGMYQFTIINPKMICKGTSFMVNNIDRVALINKVHEKECLWKEVN